MNETTTGIEEKFLADYTDVVIVANLQSYHGTQHPHAQVDWKTVPAFGRGAALIDVLRRGL